MKKALLTLSIPAAIILVAVVSCKDNKPAETVIAKVDQDSLIQRGSYLVTTMLCDDCHSPKRMGPNGPELVPELRLSGYRHDSQLPPVDTTEIKKGWTLFNPDLTSAVGMWGASFSANLTSDATGIGNWSEEQFFTALRKGKWKGMEGNRNLLPPMPWHNIGKLNDNDLKAVFAFLKSTKPVDNLVPAPKTLAELK
jgi:hypothetical protein